MRKGRKDSPPGKLKVFNLNTDFNVCTCRKRKMIQVLKFQLCSKLLGLNFLYNYKKKLRKIKIFFDPIRSTFQEKQGFSNNIKSGDVSR